MTLKIVGHGAHAVDVRHARLGEPAAWALWAVGAVAVHGVCGAWGTIAAGMFDSAGMFDLGTIGVQAIGVAAAFLWTFPVSFLLFYGLNKTIGLRVDDHLEHVGLDLHEHANRAYPEFLPEDELTPAEV